MLNSDDGTDSVVAPGSGTEVARRVAVAKASSAHARSNSKGYLDSLL